MFSVELLQTNTFACISWWVGVALVTLAAEGAVCVLTEAVVATDGFIDTLINIYKVGEGYIILIFTASLCTIVLQIAMVNTVLVLHNKHHYRFEERKSLSS